MKPSIAVLENRAATTMEKIDHALDCRDERRFVLLARMLAATRRAIADAAVDQLTPEVVS